MTKELSVQAFNHKVFGTIRVGEDGGKMWFHGNDLAGSLSYKDPSRAIRQHVPDKHKRLMRLDDSEGSRAKRPGTPNLGGNPHQMMVDEAGMYRLVFHSHLQAADDMVEWVTADVLPTLRKRCLSFR